MPDDDREGTLSNHLNVSSPEEEARQQRTLQDGTGPSWRDHMLNQTCLSAYQIACLKDIPIRTIRNAWYTLSHLLLEPNSMIAVMGCGDGALAYAMAVMNPDFHIIGIDGNRHKIIEAKEKWQLTNLEFVVSKVSKPSFPNNSLDAVVDSFTLHEVYSRQGFSDERVRDMLDSHFALLKQNGILFLHDYIHPPPGEYVMIEFPDIPSTGPRPEDMSEADLLIHFSEQARGDSDALRGFFLEELYPYAEHTRLFRLPYKWAYEFILRKDNREEWEEELSKEYTFMTARELRKTLRSRGARVLYTAPHWNHSTIRNNYEGRFNLYDDDGISLGYPSTSHVFVARKVGEGDSIALQERRPSKEPVQHLRITSVRNTATGNIIDLVSRDSEFVEFLPYRITDSGRLHVYLHDGIPRAITNAVPRSGRNLDGKRWSGHMVEAFGLDRVVLSEYDDYWTPESTQDFSLRHLGLRPANNAILEQGPEFYPNPMMIDERIETKFLNVQKSKRSLTPRWVSQITQSFSDSGKIKEFDAQHVLNAISVGLLPSARLERQILALFSMLGISAANWADAPLHLEESEVQYKSFEDLVALLQSDEKRFESTEESANSIRSLHSYFVDEGYQNGTVRGLAANDIEFIVQEDQTVNTAVVLPLIKDMKGEVLAGFIQEFLPVPERMGRHSKNITAPSFNLPPEVKDMNTAKAYIAQQFGVQPDRVLELGESYYTHNGITPQRIFPFAVTQDLRGADKVYGTYTEYAPVRYLWILQWWLFEESFALTFRRAMESMRMDTNLGLEKDIGLDSGQARSHWSVPPPIGMPIPHSPEEHEAIIAEYRASSPAPYRSNDIGAPGTPYEEINRPQENNIRSIKTAKGDGTADSGDTGSSSSGGGMEQSHSDPQDTKDNSSSRKPLKNTPSFENIDYSSIDGDAPALGMGKRKDADKKKKPPVVVPLRRPPSRSELSDSGELSATPSIITNDDGLDDDMEPDNLPNVNRTKSGSGSKSGGGSSSSGGGGSSSGSGSGGDSSGGSSGDNNSGNNNVAPDPTFEP